MSIFLLQVGAARIPYPCAAVATVATPTQILTNNQYNIVTIFAFRLKRGIADRSTVAAMKSAQREFGQRLREAMTAAGYEARPAVLEREFNLKYLGKPMTLHGVRRWLRGETIPSEDKLIVLARWLRIEPQVLRWGSTPNQVREEKLSWENAIGYRERETFEAFLALTAPQKKIIREVILAFARGND